MFEPAPSLIKLDEDNGMRVTNTLRHDDSRRLLRATSINSNWLLYHSGIVKCNAMLSTPGTATHRPPATRSGAAHGSLRNRKGKVHRWVLGNVFAAVRSQSSVLSLPVISALLRDGSEHAVPISKDRETTQRRPCALTARKWAAGHHSPRPLARFRALMHCGQEKVLRTVSRHVMLSQPLPPNAVLLVPMESTPVRGHNV